MSKIRNISKKFFAAALVMAMLVGIFGTASEVRAEARTTTTYDYSVSNGYFQIFSLKNPNVNNQLTYTIVATPSVYNVSVLAEVYNNTNLTGSPLASYSFVKNVPGQLMKVTVPANTTYYIKVSTTSTTVVSGQVIITS